jgi:hypothetical protein
MLWCELLIQDTRVVSLKFATLLLQFGSVANSNKMQVLRLRYAPLRMTILWWVRRRTSKSKGKCGSFDSATLRSG